MAQCQLSWDSYRNNICNGFSQFQQCEQFVDMTLAAEGHLVKVHKTLIALASPYLKEMILSAPCQHPVIFLNSISHEILGYMLEYIYMGKVNVPIDIMPEFIKAGKSLHIIGISGLLPAVPVAVSKAKGIYKDSMPNETEKPPRVPQDESSIEHSDGYKNIEPKTSEIPEVIEDSDTEINLDDSPTVSEIEGDDNDGKYMPTSTQKQNIEQTFRIDLLNKHATNEHQYNNLRIQSIEPVPDSLINTENQDSNDNFNQIDDHPGQELGTIDMQNHYPNFISSQSHPVIKPLQNFIQTKTIEPKPLVNVGDLVDLNNIQVLDDRVNIPMPMDLEPTASKNYSIAVELPEGDANVPKISIAAGCIEINPVPASQTPAASDVSGASPLYLVTGRGSLQMILNRYMYYTHHSSRDGRKRRWRCIDYRHKSCKAFVDTDGELIVTRKFIHTHPFHDDKIMKKGSYKEVFSSISELVLHLDAKERAIKEVS